MHRPTTILHPNPLEPIPGQPSSLILASSRGPCRGKCFSLWVRFFSESNCRVGRATLLDIDIVQGRREEHDRGDGLPNDEPAFQQFG